MDDKKKDFLKLILRRVLRTLALAAVLALVFHLIFAEKNIYWQEPDIGFYSMSTRVELRFYTSDKQSVGPAVQLVQQSFREISAICNRFDPESELSRLNATAYREPFACSDELWDILMKAKRMYDLSGGGFDVTVTPYIQLWRQEVKTPVMTSAGAPVNAFVRMAVPDAEQLAEAGKRVGLDKVQFDEEKKTVRFTVDGMSIDLGGIAKGAALDLCAKRAKSTRLVGEKNAENVPFLQVAEAWFLRKLVTLDRGYINAGGNVIALSEPPPEKEAYRVGVRNPAGGAPCAYVDILDECISTSGNYERFVLIDGKRYGHILDPRTGMPVRDMISVSVVAKHGVDADALSTAIYVRGIEFAESIKDQYPGLRVLIFYTENGNTDEVKYHTIGEWHDIVPPILKK